MEPVPNRANDERRKNFMASVPTQTSPSYVGAGRYLSPGDNLDFAQDAWDRAKDSGATHYGKHSWYAVGGDEYGAPYEVCTTEGCPAERHSEDVVDKNGYPTSRKGRVYPGGKK